MATTIDPGTTTAGATAGEAPPLRNEVPVATDKNATLRGRCIDAEGAPIAGCKVRLTGSQSNRDRMDAWLTDHGTKPEWKAPPDVTTGADGTFAVTFWPPPPYQFFLEVSRDGCAGMSGRWGTLAEGSVTDLGDIAMVPGVSVRGRVVDADGIPKAKEYVTLRSSKRASMDIAELGPRWGDQTVSRDDGTFTMRGWLHPGEYAVSTQQLDLQSPKSVTLSPDRPYEDITVVVAEPAAQATIRGRVFDETGAPASGVEIEARSEQGSWNNAISRKDGSFELRRREGVKESSTMLAVIADTFEVTDATPRTVEWGTTDVEFRVVRAGALTLRVTDERQVPVDTYTVRLVPRNRNRWSSADGRARAQGRHEDGTVVVAGLSRGDWLLLVDFPTASGLAPLFVEFSHESGPRRMDLRANTPAERTVRVVAGDDAPIAGSTVQLVDPFDKPLDDARLVMQRDHWLMNTASASALVLAEGTTDADGRVRLRGPAGRNLGICVVGPNHIPQRTTGVRIDVADELVVRVSRGARFTGKVVPPEAVAELARLAVGERRTGFDANTRPRLEFVGGQVRFPSNHVTAGELPGLLVADDGSFDVGGVPPGTWTVGVHGWIAHEGGHRSGRSFQAGQVTLVDGQTTTQELDLSYVLPGTVEGTVLLNGVPVADEAVSLEMAAQGHWINARTDAEGRFRKQTFAGTYSLSLQRMREGQGNVTLKCPTPVQVVRDQTTTMTFALVSTKLKVSVLDAAGKPVAGVRLHALGSDKGGAYLPPTDDQGFVEAELTSETVVLRVLPKELSTPAGQQRLWRDAAARGDRDPLGQHWIPLQTAVLAAGQTSTFEVRLPANTGY